MVNFDNCKTASDIADTLLKVIGTDGPVIHAVRGALERMASLERDKFILELQKMYEYQLWSAYGVGVIRQDGMWIDGGMADAEWLIHQLMKTHDLYGHVFNPTDITSKIEECAKLMVQDLLKEKSNA